MSSIPWDYIAKLVCIGDSGCGKSSLTIRLCEGRFSAAHDVTIGVEFGSRIVPVGPPYTKPYVPSPPATAPEEAAAAAASSPSSSCNTSTAQLQSAAQHEASSPRTSSKTINPAKSKPNPKQNPAAPAPAPAPASKPTPQKHMKLSLWDTAGQETYKSVTRSYFRGASGALLVFDLSRRSTFTHVTDWLNDLRQIAEPDIVVVLVGNKADLTRASSTATATATGSGDGSDNDNNNNDADDRREVSRSEAEEWARRNGILEYVETSAKSGENVEKAFMRVAERIYHNIQAGRYDLNDRRSGVKGPGAGGGGRSLNLAADSAKSGGVCC